MVQMLFYVRNTLLTNTQEFPSKSEAQRAYAMMMRGIDDHGFVQVEVNNLDGPPSTIMLNMNRVEYVEFYEVDDDNK